MQKSKKRTLRILVLALILLNVLALMGLAPISANTDSMAIDLFVFIMFAFDIGLLCFFIVWARFYKGNKKIKNGIFVVGELISVSVPRADKKQSRCRLAVRFMTKEGQEITATVDNFLWRGVLRKYKPGCKLQIKYDPGYPQNIANKGMIKR